jgi:hypothetical protein
LFRLPESTTLDSRITSAHGVGVRKRLTARAQGTALFCNLDGDEAADTDDDHGQGGHVALGCFLGRVAFEYVVVYRLGT